MLSDERIDDFDGPSSAGERKLSVARQGGLTNSTRPADPRLKAVGYGSYDGYAAGLGVPVAALLVAKHRQSVCTTQSLLLLPAFIHTFRAWPR